MLEPKTPDAEIGVVVGRFQVHKLTQGHRQLIESVCAKHNRVLILLGSTPGVKVTRSDPLDYQTRKSMIEQMNWGEANSVGPVILPIKDMPSDEDWSKAVDDQIDSVFEAGTVVIYGSRDGFIPKYSGKFKTQELAPTKSVSGTEVRNSLSTRVRNSPDFRHGVVYAAYNRHPVAYPTVDVAIVHRKHRHYVILARKSTDASALWRFPGGFVDPAKDLDLEDTALREAREECGTGLELDGPQYVGSSQIDDWRYRSQVDRIMSSLFVCRYLWGHLTPGDDVDEVRWFEVESEDFFPSLVPEHRPLGSMLKCYLEGRPMEINPLRTEEPTPGGDV